MHVIRPRLRWLTPVCAVVCLTAEVRAQDTNRPLATPVFDAIGREVRQLYERHKDSLVQVRADSAIGTLSGTGFFIDDKGTILTTSSLVGAEENVWIERGGKRLPVHIIGVDRRSSVALLSTVFKGPALPFATEALETPGLPVVVLGFPFNQPAAPAFGLISGMDAQNPDKRYFCTPHLRADLNLTPGLIGGPMLNTHGEVVGLVTGTLDGGRTCYALPAAAVQRVAEDLAAEGRFRAAWVGLLTGPACNTDGICGVTVQRVFTNSPACRAGVKPGDILVRMGSREVSQQSDVVQSSFLLRAGSEVNLGLVREGQALDVSLVAERRPDTGVGSDNELRRRRVIVPPPLVDTNAVNVKIELSSP